MKTKKIQLLIWSLFTLIILLISIGLILIGLCVYHSHMFNQSTWKFENIKVNGFQILEKN